MTNASSKALTHFLAHHSFIAITTSTSLIAVILLLVITAEREVVRASQPSRDRRDLAAFTVVLLPMLFLFATIIVARFIRLS